MPKHKDLDGLTTLEPVTNNCPYYQRSNHFLNSKQHHTEKESLKKMYSRSEHKVGIHFKLIL